MGCRFNWQVLILGVMPAIVQVLKKKNQWHMWHDLLQGNFFLDVENGGTWGLWQTRMRTPG